VARTYFTEKTFRFLKDLEAHNEREWFQANKARYEEDLVGPALQFIVDFAGPLAKISPHFRADPKPVGGSLFRIYRDTRFSKDKSPYKTFAGLHFRHEAGKDAHTPGFYLHIQPGQCFAGAGLWHPDGKATQLVRERIDHRQKEWKSAVTGKRFRDVLELSGDQLKRAPRGFDPEHPLVDDLRRKDFVAVAMLTQKEVTGSGLMERFTTCAKAAAPLVRFLCEATGQDF
jgi:uncharacterized protein (TIGR02453 family)